MNALECSLLFTQRPLYALITGTKIVDNYIKIVSIDKTIENNILTVCNAHRNVMKFSNLFFYKRCAISLVYDCLRMFSIRKFYVQVIEIIER